MKDATRRTASGVRARRRLSLSLSLSAALICGTLIPLSGVSPASASASGLDQQILLDGVPLANAPVSVRAVPTDTSYWPATSEPYPVVGRGQTDGSGNVQATTDPGLDGIQSNPAFETEAGSITLAVDYTGSDGSLVQAYTATESLAPYADPILAQHTVNGPNGPLANADLTVYAEPEYTQQWPQRAFLPELAACVTDAGGRPQCYLNLSSVQSDGAFLHNGVLTYDVWYQDAAGGEHLAFRAQEYVWGGWDTDLWQQKLTDASGNVLSSTPVVISAVPASPASWTAGIYPEVGSGTTDASGDIHTIFSPGDLVNNPGFTHGGGLTLDVDYQDASGAWQTGTTAFQQLGPQPDPVMNHEIVRDGSGTPESDTTLLARLEPVDPSSWTGGAYPIIGAGSTDDSGRAVLTPALVQYVGNGTFETTNGYMVVDLYSQAPDGSLVFVTRVPYYLVAQVDPLLLRTQVLDSSGSPAAGKRLVVRTAPRPGSSAKPLYVGGGYSDASGMAHASIDLSRVAGNANYEDSSGGVVLDVYYWDQGVLQLGATAARNLTRDGETLVPPASAPISSVYQPSAASGGPTPALSTPLNGADLGPSSQGVSGAGVLRADAFSPTGAYEGTAAEYVGAAPPSQTYATIVDVTQEPGGGTEDVGCLQTIADSHGNNACQWTNPGTDTTPVADTAVTANGVPSSSAVTVFLRWSDIVQQTGSQFNQTSLSKVDGEVSQIIKYGKKVVLVPWFQSGYSSGSNAGGWRNAIESTSSGDQVTYTSTGGEGHCPTANTSIDASGSSSASPPAAFAQQGTITSVSGCTYDSGAGTNNGGSVKVTYGFSSSAIVHQQTELNWGCDRGTLPTWEANSLRSNAGQLQAVCDGYGTHDYMPDYWSSTFKTDWDGFISQISSYFGCTKGSDTPNTICADPVDAAYDKSDVLYVRAGLGLTDEGQPYEQVWSTASGSLEDQSGVQKQLFDWAQQEPLSDFCSTGQGVISNSPNLAGYFDAWQRCRLTDDYMPDFSYAPVMYPLTDFDELQEPPNEWVAEDVASWSLGTGLALGSNGLNYAWVFDHVGYGDGTLDNPPQSLTPQMQIIQSLWDDEYYGGASSPSYFELQSVDAQAMNCFQSCSPTGASDTLANNAYYPTSRWSSCYPNYDPSEDIYMTQQFSNGSVGTLEVYYDDLDGAYLLNSDRTRKYPGLYNAYTDWETGVSPGDFYSTVDPGNQPICNV